MADTPLPLKAIREKIAELLKAKGLRGGPYMPFGNFTPPAFGIRFDSRQYLEGIQDQWSVFVFVATALDAKAQENLDGFISGLDEDGNPTDPVRDALEQDPTLGELVSDLSVDQVGEWGTHELAGATYLGARWTIRIIW